MKDDQRGELTQEAIEALFARTNFGGAEKTDIGRRGLMSECVLKRAAGYHEGHTIESICTDAGFISASTRKPNKRGIRWAFNQLYKSSSPTILERLNTRPDVSAIPDSDIITGLKQERGSLRHRVEKLRGQRDKAEDKLLDDSAVVEALRELVEAEWMVSHDYGGGRDGLITKIETVLAAHDKRQQAERGEG